MRPTPAPANSITPESDGCPTPLPSPQVTTAANGTFSLGSVPNGHYLLVIGNDSVSTTGTVQATVHDNITLTGGNQTLRAPALPPVPTVTPPAWETNGDYRIATLNATTEAPCFVAWQSERVLSNLAPGTIDEWLLENVRANNAYAQTGSVGGATIGFITTGNASVSGGASCSQMLAPLNMYGLDPRAEWFAGEYVPYVPGSSVSASGIAEFPVDPRSFVDPNFSIWP